MAHANKHACTVGAANYEFVTDRAENALVTRCETHERYLTIPSKLEGHAVIGLGSSSFAKLGNVTGIECPAGIREIGPHAFERCRNLRRIVFPRELATFDPGWLSGCAALESIDLPGMAPTVPKGLFGSHCIRRLRIGPGTHTVEIPRAQPLMLDEIDVDEDSPPASANPPAISASNLARHEPGANCFHNETQDRHVSSGSTWRTSEPS